MKHLYFYAEVLVFIVLFAVQARSQKITIDGNKADRKAWFSQLGYGLLIQWSAGGQLGDEPIASLESSSGAFQESYFNTLPATFQPLHLDPAEWVALARRAGIKYIVFAAKQADGFCMWDTHTTNFNIMHSNYGQDILKQVADACKKEGLAFGILFSPVDLHVMHKQGVPLSRISPDSESTRNTALWQTNQQQLRELLSNYDNIDILSIDEDRDWANPLVANFAWQLDPDLVITRGGMTVPQDLYQDSMPDGPWEWQMPLETKEGKPLRASDIAMELCRVRAMGGNLLLQTQVDVGGHLDARDTRLLQQTTLWTMANHQAIENMRPWKISHFHSLWYAQSTNTKYIYVMLPSPGWKRNTERAFLLHPLKGSAKTKIEVIGQQKSTNDSSEWHHRSIVSAATVQGLFVDVVRTQQLSEEASFPVILRITGVSYQAPEY